MKQMNKNVVKAVVIAQLAVSSLFTMAESRFRDDSFEPTVVVVKVGEEYFLE